MAVGCDSCRKVPVNSKAEGNLYPWIKLEYPVNAAVTQPSMAPGMRAAFARITDDRVFCTVACLRTWLLVQERIIVLGQERTSQQFELSGGVDYEDA